ncbi:hypothetical protein ACFWPV_09815 [Streptomyces uncialis]|uniref:hypothetical protein n=1 Tax=Streptomyces uncialis TaxID=1048205 RepID=UPI00366846A0
MPTVRTTLHPATPIEVGDAEYLDLKRQGLLIEEAPPPPPAPTAAPGKPAIPAKTAKES